jgi:hypothetical protein
VTWPAQLARVFTDETPPAAKMKLDWYVMAITFLTTIVGDFSTEC